MTLRVSVPEIVPASRRRVPLPLRLATAPLAAAATTAGARAFGGKVTDDFGLAMVLTGVWLAVAGASALLTGLRFRQLALPVVGGFLVVAIAIGAWLALSTLRDRVVSEQLATGQVLAEAPSRAVPTRPPGARS